MIPTTVFNRAHYEMVKTAQRILHDLVPVFDKAEICGLECQQYRQYAQQLQTQLSSIEREFLSPPPTR